MSPISGPALQDALSQLMKSELIYGRGAPPDATYIFKHALVQDTAYASLLLSRRQRIHAEIAKALIERFRDRQERSEIGRDLLGFETGERNHRLEQIR